MSHSHSIDYIILGSILWVNDGELPHLEMKTLHHSEHKSIYITDVPINFKERIIANNVVMVPSESVSIVQILILIVFVFTA